MGGRGNLGHVRFCESESDPCSGHHEADGQQFACGNAGDAYQLEACAQDVVGYSTGGGGYGYGGSDSTDDTGGRSIGSGGGRVGLGVLFVPLFAGVRRSRSQPIGSPRSLQRRDFAHPSNGGADRAGNELPSHAQDRRP